MDPSLSFFFHFITLKHPISLSVAPLGSKCSLSVPLLAARAKGAAVIGRKHSATFAMATREKAKTLLLKRKNCHLNSLIMLVLVNLQFQKCSSNYFVMKCSNLPEAAACFTFGLEELSECEKVHFVALYHFFLSS